MPDLLGFPKWGIGGDVQKPFPGLGEPSPSPSPAAGMWGAGSPDYAISFLWERIGEQSHVSCQDQQDIV